MSRPPFAQRRPLLLSAFFACLVILIAGGTGIYVLSDRGLGDAFSLVRVATLIDRLYQDEVDWEQLTEAGLSEMFSHLDRYSGYVEPRRWDRLREELGGSYTGIGVSVLGHDDGLLIMSVREDGPAAAAGILSGDIIIKVDSIWLTGLDVYEATDVLRGPEGTEVSLKLVRPINNDTSSVNIRRRKIDLVHIPFAGFTPDSAIYVRLLDFDAGATRDLKKALDSLLAKPGVRPIGVILDLRGNPGGLFAEAYETASLFLDKGRFIVGTDGRSRWSQERHYSRGPDITAGLPLAIIVDRGSASSSEIVAGSLSQLGRAILVGDTTFGKGLVQGFDRLYDGSAVRLTISRYFLADSLYLNLFDSALNEIGSGLPPDYPIRFAEQGAFPRALERSLLLAPFAARYQEEIIAASDHFELDDSWLNKFEQYALGHGFEYRSATTERAQTMLELVIQRDLGRAARRIAETILERSGQHDGTLFARYGPYIKMRLKQMALERKHGSYTAYLKAVVPSRPDIKLAAQLLKSTTP